jgi:glycosyltransferase involved in cell wall biosynthesis
MKVLLVAHGYPPELVGGTEHHVQTLARGLRRRGVEVVVVAGSMEHEAGFRISEDVDRDPESGATLRVRRIHRADLFFDHWQKSASAPVAEAFREILREERPDLVHVHHWIRLTRDLVFCAALEGIPAVVTLHDLWTSCLLAFRVRPGTHEFCERLLARGSCLECAGGMPPYTPWVSPDELGALFDARREELLRELELAGAVIVPSRSHAETLERFLAFDASRLAFRVIPHGRDLELTPSPALPPPDRRGRLVLSSWGHLHPLKGPDLILDAIARLADPSRVELHLAGGEVLEEFTGRLRAQAEGLNVTLHGAFSAEELSDHAVARAHVMVSGTRAVESWGLILDEAVALRLPMVLPRSGAFPERLEGGALFFEPRDPASLAAALQRLLDEEGLLERLRDELPPLAQVVPSVEEHLRRVVETFEVAIAEGAPEVPPEDPARARVLLEKEQEWDRGLSSCSAEELGFA